MSQVVQRITRIAQVAVLAFITALSFSNVANATTYNFTIPFASFHIFPVSSGDFVTYGRVFEHTTSGNATVDVSGGNVTLNLTAYGSVFGMHADGSINTSDLKVSNAVMTQTLVMSGINQINSPLSVTTQTAVSGTTTVSDIGLGAGPLTVSSMASYMDWSTYNGPDASAGYIQQMTNLGPANFWMGTFYYLWSQTAPLSTPILRFDMWFKVGADFTYNGINYLGGSSGDTHGDFTNVPEPASMSLLGLSLLGGALARRKRA